MNNNKRVVITSMGIVSPIGIGEDKFWQNYLAKQSGLKDIKTFNTEDFSVKQACEIEDFKPKEYLGEKGLRNLDRITSLLLVAAKLALNDRTDIQNTGIIIGTYLGGIHSIFDFDRIAKKEGFNALNPALFANTALSSAASQISLRFGITKLCETFSSGSGSGLAAIGFARKHIMNNLLDSALCGGAEELNMELFSAIYKLNLLKGQGTNDLVLGEGAAVFFLDSLENALKSDRTILAEIVGFGQTFNSNSIINKDSVYDASSSALDICLKEAQLNAEEIDCIITKTNGISQEDDLEAGFFSEYFGEHHNNIRLVRDLKTLVGESYAASSALSVALAIKQLNYDNKLDKQVNTCLISSLVNSRFNSCLLLKKHRG